MPTTMKLPYTRFVRQVSGENKTITGWKSAMNTTFEALKIAPWFVSDAGIDSVGLPLNTPLSFSPSHEFDCYKMSSTVTASGKQTCHMGMVAYRFKIPTDAIDNDKRITSMTFNLGADKFCVKGLKAVAYLSDTATPPTDWTVCRTGNVATEDITTGGVTHGVLPSLEATLALSQNKSEDFALAISHTSDYVYLYIIVTNWDYEDFRATREYYIEGSGMLDGGTAQFTFDAVSVTADTPASPLQGLGIKITSYTSVTSGSISSFTRPIAKMYTFWPGTYVETFKAALSPAYVQAYEDVTGNSSVTGQVYMLPITFPHYNYRGFRIEGLSVNLTSVDMSVLVNVWVGVPTKATDGGYIPVTTLLDGFYNGVMTAEQLSEFMKGTANVTVSTTISEIPPFTLVNMPVVNVGQYIMKKGNNYTEATVFPISIPRTLAHSLQMFVCFSPHDLGVPSTTTRTSVPLTPKIYFT